MKANFKKNISLATTMLLGANQGIHAIERDIETSVKSSFLYYSEKDGIEAKAPQINISSLINEDNTASATITFDSVTGSTPTGEVPTSKIQSTTSSSGQAITTHSSALPTKSFSDLRKAIALSWTHTQSRLFKISSGFNYSTERDYNSTGLSLNLAKDTEDRLTTWNVGLSYTEDNIWGTDKLDGVAGIPQSITNVDNRLRQSLSENKLATELRIGFTQVLTKNSLFLISYSVNNSTGYHNDPYKLVSLVDSTGIPIASLYEARPDERKRNIFYGQYIHNIGGNVLKLDYRHFNDDWGVESNTFAIKYRIKLASSYYIEPHMRYYSQSFHQFYLRNTRDTDAIPQYVSSDSRLSAFDAYTYGLKVGLNKEKYELSGRLEQMQQKSTQSTKDAPGKLSEYDLFSAINAIIAQVNFSIFF